MKREILVWMLAIGAGTLAALLALGLLRVGQLAMIGSAYKAKLLCSGVFVSGRAAESVLRDDLEIDDLRPLRHIATRVDVSRRKVTARLWLLPARAAVYRPGLGCTLVNGLRAPLLLTSLAADPPAPRQDMDTELLPRLEPVLKWAFSEPDPGRLRRTRAVVVLHDGKIVAERYAAGFGPHMPLPGWSMAKMALNALVGRLVREGRISLDDPVGAPEWRAENDPRGRITLGHLLQMSSGLEFSEENGAPLQDVTYMLLREPDAAAYAASKPLRAEPGSRWYYSSGNTNIISRWLRQVVGESGYPGLPRHALFSPLGMSSAVLETDATGTFVASSFMYATARDWAKLGQLYLQDGVWHGQRLIPEGWVRYSTTPVPTAPRQEYGAHVWLKLSKAYQTPGASIRLPEDAFHAVGHEAQLMTIIPSRRLVILRLGLTRYPTIWPHDEFVRRIISALEP